MKSARIGIQTKTDVTDAARRVTQPETKLDDSNCTAASFGGTGIPFHVTLVACDETVARPIKSAPDFGTLKVPGRGHPDDAGAETSAACSVVMAELTTATEPVSARLCLFLDEVLRRKVPTAVTSRAVSGSGAQLCKIDVGCEDDLRSVIQNAQDFGVDLRSVTLTLRAGCGIPPSNTFLLNTRVLAAAMGEPSGVLARLVATHEAQRCINGANVDCWASAPGTAADTSDAGAAPLIIIRVPEGCDAATRARAVVARIHAVLPHPRLLMEVAEGGEEDLVYPPMGNAALALGDFHRPPHFMGFPLESSARLAGPPPATGAAQTTEAISVVDDKPRAAATRVLAGHITVGAFSNGGASAVSTGHGLPAAVCRASLREAKKEYGLHAELLVRMDPSQFDGTGVFAFIHSPDAEPHAVGCDETPVKQTALLPLVADASLFRIAHVAVPTGLLAVPQLARFRNVVDSVAPAASLPPWSEYSGRIDIWGIHGKDTDGVVRPRHAIVVGRSTKELVFLPSAVGSSSSGGSSPPQGAVFASTVVYIAEVLGLAPGEEPLKRGDSGGSATQTICGDAIRLHSLVGSRAWYSVGSGASKRWFVLLIPIHFVVAQIAELLSARATPVGSAVRWSRTQELSEPAGAGVPAASAVAGALPISSGGAAASSLAP